MITINQQVVSPSNNKAQLKQQEAEKTEDENKKQVIKHTFVDVFGATTMHGLPNIIRSENVVMRVIWIFLFIGGIGCSIYCKKQTIFVLYLFFNSENY